jgi:hypothetical protein
VENDYEFDIVIPQSENFKFIYIGFENEKGEVIYRKDMTTFQRNVKINFKSLEKPIKWVYWLFDNNEQWQNRLEFKL